MTSLYGLDSAQARGTRRCFFLGVPESSCQIKYEFSIWVLPRRNCRSGAQNTASKGTPTFFVVICHRFQHQWKWFYGPLRVASWPPQSGFMAPSEWLHGPLRVVSWPPQSGIMAPQSGFMAPSEWYYGPLRVVFRHPIKF